MKDINTILKAINLADLDNHKSIEVNIEDLKTLSRRILELQKTCDYRARQINILGAKLSLRSLNKTVCLDIYA